MNLVEKKTYIKNFKIHRIFGLPTLAITIYSQKNIEILLWSSVYELYA